MDDDLNTAAALGELFSLARELFRYVSAADAAGRAVDADALEDAEDAIVDGLDALLIGLPETVAQAPGGQAEHTGDDQSCTTENVALPPAARLAQEGRWDDLELLHAERLSCGDATYACALRDHYRAQKDWAGADRVRDALQAAGFDVRDTTQGTQVVPKA
jgi:cysteinyl-tRNA synthetase